MTIIAHSTNLVLAVMNNLGSVKTFKNQIFCNGFHNYCFGAKYNNSILYDDSYVTYRKIRVMNVYMNNKHNAFALFSDILLQRFKYISHLHFIKKQAVIIKYLMCQSS